MHVCVHSTPILQSSVHLFFKFLLLNVWNYWFWTTLLPSGSWLMHMARSLHIFSLCGGWHPKRQCWVLGREGFYFSLLWEGSFFWNFLNQFAKPSQEPLLAFCSRILVALQLSFVFQDPEEKLLPSALLARDPRLRLALPAPGWSFYSLVPFGEVFFPSLESTGPWMGSPGWEKVPMLERPESR